MYSDLLWNYDFSVQRGSLIRDIESESLFDVVENLQAGDLLWLCKETYDSSECAYVVHQSLECTKCHKPVEQFQERVDLTEDDSTLAHYENTWFWNGLYYERHYVNYEGQGYHTPVEPACAKCGKKGLKAFHRFAGPFLFLLDPLDDPTCPRHGSVGDAVVLVEEIRAWQGELSGGVVHVRNHGARYSRDPEGLGFQQKTPTRKYAPRI